MVTFSYHPLAADLSLALQEGDYARALVIDDEVDEIFEVVDETRTLELNEPNLPAGVYWFLGIPSPILLVVASGQAGTSDRLEMAAWDDDAEEPLAEAYRWAEALWEKGRSVPEPNFEVGARLVTVPSGADVEVKARSFLAGSWAYTVSGPSGRESVLESRLAAADFSEEPGDWIHHPPSTAARLGATLTRTKLRGKFADTVYSFQATRTVFRAYQFKPVLKLLQSGQARLLIADEVGLGKTIEAGLIWTELEARHEADRVLIVAPSGLVEKWRDEMAERFGFDLKVLDRAELRKLLELHQSGRMPRRQSYIVSLETMRSWDGLKELQDNPPEFDLVIVDEAHSMRNSSTKSYLLGTQLSDWTGGANLVFLTATPINLRENDLLHLLGLLEPADFAVIEDLELRLKPTAVLNEVAKRLSDKEATPQVFEEILQQLSGMVLEDSIKSKPEFGDLMETLSTAPLDARSIAIARRAISRLNTLSTTVTRTRRGEIDEQKPLRGAANIQIEWSEIERNFYQEFLKWCAVRAKQAKTAMYFSMQMPIRLASTSIHMAARNVLKDEAETWQGDTNLPPHKNWVDPQPELRELARQVLAQPDSKVSKLAEVLAELHELGRPALLFTWSKGTLSYLREKFGSSYKIAVLNGDVPRLQRRQIMKDFRAGGFDFLFANKVASEGLDFEFCSAVINYDLPWNPMEVEQRIGRIDRIGQTSEKILVRNFYNEEAIDSRIMMRVLERINIFEQSIGELEPIIGDHIELLNAALDFSLSPEQQEEKAQQFLTAIEAQKVALQDVSDSSAGLMIAQDVEIAGLEEELASTGKYVGQSELANLLSDWAETDDGGRVEWLNEGTVIEVRGNPTMAGRVVELIQYGRRTRAETGSLAVDLQNGNPIYLSLDQELARVSETDMLSSTHPLVMAATEVPGHKHARFASVTIPKTHGAKPGAYLVTLAHAVHAARSGDEIWGAAVSARGEDAGTGPVDALMASLARGAWKEGPPVDATELQALVPRTMRQLEKKHRIVQTKRDEEEESISRTRKSILTDQHERRIKGINRRLETMIERGRGEDVIRMVEGQRRRQQDRYDQLIAEEQASSPPAVSLSYLAVCALTVEQ